MISESKLRVIRRMLSVDGSAEADEGGESALTSTVFELAGADKAGLLADCVHFLTHNGCDVRSAAVWTYNGRVAFVVSALEKGHAIRDGVKLQRLRQLLLHMMDAAGASVPFFSLPASRQPRARARSSEAGLLVLWVGAASAQRPAPAARRPTPPNALRRHPPPSAHPRLPQTSQPPPPTTAQATASSTSRPSRG